MPDSELSRVLSEIQRRGAIGRGSIEDAIAHADQFVKAAPLTARVAVDLGSGGGLPGLVLAVARPDLRLTLVERRAKRVDLLMFALRALELTDRVDVYAGDVERLLEARSVSGGGPDDEPVDLVTARSFAPPLIVFRTAVRFLAPGGSIVLSEPPAGEARWTGAELDSLHLVDEGRFGGVRRLRFSGMGATTPPCALG